MRPDATEIELAAIVIRAAEQEARRQAAVQRGDYAAVREYEQELSRLHIRYTDLEGRGDERNN